MYLMNGERKSLEQLIGSRSLAADGPHTTAYHGLRALMLAVLDDAIATYRGHATLAQAEADRWIHTGRNRSPFSFHTVCEVLGLDPDATRRQLAHLRTQPPPRRLRLRPNGRRVRRR